MTRLVSQSEDILCHSLFRTTRMTRCKQISLRLPIDLLDALDARRDAEHDRTSIITSLLAHAMDTIPSVDTGAGRKPSADINKLTKRVEALERAITQLTNEGYPQTKVIDIQPNSSLVISDADELDSDDEDDNYEPDSDEYLEHIEDDSSPLEPSRCTHAQLIVSIGEGLHRGWQVRLTNNWAYELHFLGLDFIQIIDPSQDKPVNKSTREVAFYVRMES